jgi:hypothetical protein
MVFAVLIISGVERYPALNLITSAFGYLLVKLSRKAGLAPANE